MSRRVVVQLALALCLVLPAAAGATGSYVVRKLALSGETAPGTSGEVFADTPWPGMQANDAGQVAVRASLVGAPDASGVWVDAGAGLVLRMRDGDPAPDTGGDSYGYFCCLPELDAAGAVSAVILLASGSGAAGLFLDTAGVDSALLVSGQPAPAGVDGTLDLSSDDLYKARRNPAGALAVATNVSGNWSGPAVFARAPDGALRTVALGGDVAPGTGGETWWNFAYPLIDPTGHVAFRGSYNLILGSEEGVFAETASGIAPYALTGDVAPDGGGATFASFVPLAWNADGDVLFMASLSGGGTGYFLADGSSVVAVQVPTDVVPEAGGVAPSSTQVLAARRDGFLLALAQFTGGTSDMGILLRKAGASTWHPVALAGEVAPDSEGAHYVSFADADPGAAGDIAFVGLLDDGRWGVYVASPAPGVPALPAAWALAAALALAASARTGIARLSRRRGR